MAVRKTSTEHRWSFFRAGGVDQVLLRSGEDIRHLPLLDQKLWVALSCPTRGLEFDQKTLALLDTDGDGRVRVPEILGAIAWLSKALVSLDGLLEESDCLPLSSLATDNPVGKALSGAAKQILAGLGKGGEKSITLADAMETAKVFANARLNGDGVVPPSTIEDVVLHKVAAELIATVDGVMDRSGQLGFDRSEVAEFFDALKAHVDWQALAEADPKGILPLGEGTGAAHGTLTAVAAKIDDFFARCRLAAFDPRTQALLNGEEKAYLEVAAKDLSITAAEVAHFPLAQVSAKGSLPLVEGLNPAWQDALDKFRDVVVRPLLGSDRSTLTEAEWTGLRGRFAGYEGWMGKKAGAAVASLGVARARKILASGARAQLEQCIADDLSVADDFAALQDVEKLVRFHRHLFRLLNNFVAFGDFYSRKRPAVFQAGTLYLDARSCDLCVRVDDAGKHGALAGLAKTYLAYCDLSRPTGAKMTVACAFTAGDSDHLMAGRNGLFYDLQGLDWDATITRVIENPISLGQAFFAPYKRILRWIEEQVAKRAAAADDAANAKLVSAAQATGDAATKGAAAAPKPKFDVGVVAALGVAVGGITAAIGALLDSLFGLGKWMPLGLLGIVLLISGPSMVIAWLKLRQRNLGPILDANGWAVNGRMKVNIPLGGSLTELAKLPDGASRQLADPFAEKKRWWPKVLVVVLVLAGLAWGLWQWDGAPEWAKPTRDHLRKLVTFQSAPVEAPKDGTPEAPK